MKKPLRWAFYGSGRVSNRAAEYFHRIVGALSSRGHQVTFFENFSEDPSERDRALDVGLDADVIVKASGDGALDEELERAVLDLKREDNRVVFWDVGAHASSQTALLEEAFRSLIPRYDLVFTYEGGDSVVSKYESLGARKCIPIDGIALPIDEILEGVA